MNIRAIPAKPGMELCIASTGELYWIVGGDMTRGWNGFQWVSLQGEAPAPQPGVQPSQMAPTTPPPAAPAAAPMTPPPAAPAAAPMTPPPAAPAAAPETPPAPPAAPMMW